MLEKTIDITFPIKENLLLSLRENQEEFTQELRFLSALMLYRKARLSLGKQQIAMKVVVNTTPIISLAAINHLLLLEKLFGKIIIAEAVYQEIKAKQSHAYHEIDSPFIEVQKIQGVLYKGLLLNQLDSGEMILNSTLSDYA
jgi:hypothetical protein